MRRIGRSLVLAALVATACRDGAKTEPVAVSRRKFRCKRPSLWERKRSESRAVHGG